MKYFKMIFLSLAMMAFLAACGGNAGHDHESHDNDAMHNDATENDGAEMQVKENNFTYACPMHPEQGGNEPGKCSKCGMDYEKVEKPAEK